jgi:gamma-glutamylcyclotransferase (GGCT)/AIG2-like uncharacterized protein YtfP
MRAFVVLICMSDVFPTSPTLNTDQDVVSTAKAFTGATTLDLTDEETKVFLETTVSIVRKHQTVWKTLFPFDTIEQCMRLLDELEKELAYTLMERLNVVVRVDSAPVLEGGRPIIEFVGKMEGTSLHLYGQDHEKKAWEARKAKARGEDYLHQKDNYKSQ